MLIVHNRQWHTVLSQRSFQLARRSGVKASVRQVMDRTYRAKDATNESTDGQPLKFLFESDVKSDYASTNHDILIQQLSDMIDHLFLLDLVCQDVHRTVSRTACTRMCNRLSRRAVRSQP
ncbi:hypothetical protein OAL64_00165 [bacterium]|nr:hypothetical protein [bacterium]